MKEREKEKEEEKWRFIFSPVYQTHPECATGRVWLPGNRPCYSDRRKCSETPQLSRSLQEHLKSHRPPQPTPHFVEASFHECFGIVHRVFIDVPWVP